MSPPTPSSQDLRQERLGQIEAATRADLSQAIALASKALADGLEDPMVLHLAAQGLRDQARHHEALSLLQRARALAPEDVLVLNGLGLCQFGLGNWDEAVAAYDAALAIRPDFLPALLNKASALSFVKRNEAAEAAFRLAAKLHPTATEAWVSLASLAARGGDTADARHYANRALSLDPTLAAARLAVIQADLTEGNFAAAETGARDLIRASRLSADDRSQAYGLLGDALDGLGRFDEAFDAYDLSNTLLEPSASEMRRNLAETESDQVRRVARYVAASPSLLAAAPGSRRDARVREHAFLIGFPRSGTTLLEQVLSGHPDILSLEERPMLEMIARPLLAGDEPMRRLGELTGAQADELRAAYWRGAESFAGADLAGKVIVDKNPAATVYLPVLARLFPEARIMVARRDPRDVVLSCYRRRFRLGPMTAEFLSLESAAAYYDAVMELGETCLRQIANERREVRHEDLVSDLEGGAAEVLRFLGLDWAPEVLDFTARARLASTPSAKQLVGGLTSDGVAHWRRYAAQMAPVLPRLAPWVQRFGYEATGALPSPAATPTLAGAHAQIQQAAQAGDWARLFQVVDKALAAGVRDAALLRIRASRLQRERRLDEAISDLEAALALEPDDEATARALALARRTGGIHVAVAAGDGARRRLALEVPLQVDEEGPSR